MKKLFILLALLVALSVSASAQEASDYNVIGLQGGAFIQDGYKPELAYCFVTEVSVEAVPLINQLFKKIETSVLYANRTQPEVNTAEIYAMRMFTVRQYNLYKSLYIGLGAGYYYLLNSQGGDEDYLAARFEFGTKINDVLEIYVGADALKTHTTTVFPHISFVFLQ